MRLTRQTSYAIRTMVYCAVNAPDLSRVADIARAHSMSELFLFKLIKPLVENGLIETVRGRHGGIRLGRPADEITLLDVIKLTEENFAMAECFEGGDVSCPLVDACDLNAALRHATTGVAEHSLHISGRAIDVRLTSAKTAALRDAAIAMKKGGVGYYAESNFVHIDTGAFRTW